MNAIKILDINLKAGGTHRKLDLLLSSVASIMILNAIWVFWRFLKIIHIQKKLQCCWRSASFCLYGEYFISLDLWSRSYPMTKLLKDKTKTLICLRNKLILTFKIRRSRIKQAKKMIKLPKKISKLDDFIEVLLKNNIHLHNI